MGIGPMTDGITIEVYQHDWIPGFAAFLNDGSLSYHGTAHVVLNLGSLLAAVDGKDIASSEVPHFVAESLMHEVFHALESWANVEFSEDRVNALIEKYRTQVAELADAPDLNSGP